jgi:hypothetical protein
MPRPTQQDVLLAILAMDAYSRGANGTLKLTEKSGTFDPLSTGITGTGYWTGITGTGYKLQNQPGEQALKSASDDAIIMRIPEPPYAHYPCHRRRPPRTCEQSYRHA